MPRRESVSLGRCLKYNIGSFLAVFVLGWLALQQRILSPCPDAGLQASPLRALRSDQEDEVETKAEKGSDVAEAPLQAAKEADRYDQAAKEADKDDHTGGPAVEREGNQDRQAEGSKGLWVFCAPQWQDCTCQGRVRWGNEETWLVMTPKDAKPLTVTCSVQVLEDVLPGDDGKHCECEIILGSAFHKGLNPMWLPEVEEDKAPLVASCQLWEEDRGSRWGQEQWKAVEAFCSQDWSGEEPGERTIPLETMRQLMEARVDPRFREVYQTLGPFFADELIRSVHMFSQELIIVVNFGMTSSTKLTPERFPQLLLLHARPMDVQLKRSFNFNKLRAFLFSRALAGVGLDSDQWVAPGVDRLFDMTEREIHEKYPFPIMPVHFLDRGPKDLGVWWSRYCPNDVCSLQTMRWGHAHPTWTYWALPFLGRWLRRNFRDETLPATGKAIALRVVEIPEDEDLLNVGLWEEKAHKQWCKFDITDPLEFQFLFDWKTKYGNRCSMGGPGCSNISPDRRFYKRGAAKLFYTAHHAVNPTDTHKQVDRIMKKWKEGTWPSSTIVYERKLWVASDLKKAHPQLECLV
ncbi:unnamed protein product [Durusdinium trenchii]|uniref:Uncharacterized protein n=1 Tax=Durusdinium trenchii TaxID=1381693 RepID=A0ABP0NMU0_9DINO